MTLQRTWVIDCLHTMLLSREADRREAMSMRQGKGWMQIPSSGHEAMAALAYALRPDDYIFPSYRDRALMLARGVTVLEMALDFLAREGSSSEGRNLPGHFSSRRHNIFSISSPTGSQCLPAAGAAWGIKQGGGSGVVTCHIGDAATRQGEFYEAICFAVQERLPVIFVVEDNGYGISTRTDTMMPFRLGIFDSGLVERIDGRDTLSVYESGRQAIGRARSGLGPTILWCELDRLGSHTSSDDHSLYRPASELAQIAVKDPIRRLADELILMDALTPREFETMRAEAAEAAAEAVRSAEATPSVDPVRAVFDVYGSTGTARLHDIAAPALDDAPLRLSAESKEETLASAIMHTFEAGLSAFPELLMFGEDIADPKGGVFGLTRGLSTRFPDRVTNSPLAEATIIGTAVGLAATGWRPVFEIQFIDFLLPGFNQLASQASTLRWRTGGQWTCPAVIYAPYGAYTPGAGIWHSQSNEAWWAHMPGLRVAVPTTPQDAAGLFWSAFQDDDPSLILLPKRLLRERAVVDSWEAIPFGKAAIRREGEDVTVVAWGNGVDLALQAADRMAEGGRSIEVIDLRTLVPCDWDTVQDSLRRTGRLVVIQEDMRTCGFGQAVISEMVTDPERFYCLTAPPQLVTREDVHIPYCPSVEEYLLPGVDDVIDAIRTTLE